MSGKDLWRRHLLLWTVVPALAAGLSVWVACLWSAASGGSVASLAWRGLAAALLVAAASTGAGLWLLRSWRRTLEMLEKSVAQLAAGDHALRPLELPRPELAGLSRQLAELGIELQKQQEQSRRQYRRQLRRHGRQVVERLSRGVVREIQQPLAGILGFIDMSMRRSDLDGQLRNYLTLVEREARQARESLERIVRHLDEAEPAVEELDVNELVAETVKQLAESLAAEQISLRLSLAQQPLRVLGDNARLRYLLSVLLQNAREAMLPGGGTLEVSSRLDADGRVVILVRDQGRGIPPEQQPFIFTPFFTSKGSRKGAGLSLCSAERVARQHGGELDFWSRPGEGSVFFVYLPAASGPVPAPASSNEQGQQ